MMRWFAVLLFSSLAFGAQSATVKVPPGYAVATFYNDDAQRKAAEGSLAALQKSKPFKEPIVTEIKMAGAFYPAEDYHQNFYRTNPVKYQIYRKGCGRDARLKELWGASAGH